MTIMDVDENTIVVQRGTHRARIEYQDFDHESANPRDNDGNVGVMACFHRRYDLGDPDGDLRGVVKEAMDRYGRWAIAVRHLKRCYGVTTVLPIGLLDHSGLHVWVGGGAHWSDPGGWDSGTVGLVYDTPETREETGIEPEQIEAALRAEVEEYDRYLRGEVYGVLIEEVDPQGDWNEVDSCWGYLGTEYATETARDRLDEYEPPQV